MQREREDRDDRDDRDIGGERDKIDAEKERERGRGGRGREREGEGEGDKHTHAPPVRNTSRLARSVLATSMSSTRPGIGYL